MLQFTVLTQSPSFNTYQLTALPGVIFISTTLTQSLTPVRLSWSKSQI